MNGLLDSAEISSLLVNSTGVYSLANFKIMHHCMTVMHAYDPVEKKIMYSLNWELNKATSLVS